MRILYVNDNDLAGRRFNGHDLQIMLNAKKGFEAKQFVVHKEGDDKNTVPMIKSEGGDFMRSKCIEFHKNISMQSVVYPFGELLGGSEEFKNADIVHYHLIFNFFMSLYSFKKLANLKPTVWTLHDPWALTGHCVHPMECEGWKTGCRNCPYLERHSPLQVDHAFAIWNIKKEIYKNLDVDIVVASKWMYEMVKKSPLTKNFERVHLIPFGIDVDLFKRRYEKDLIREKIGIKKDNFVIMFRQAQEWKGVSYIIEMLKKLENKNNITILTVGIKGMLKEIQGEYQVIEYDWVKDDNLMVDLYSASDLFLMPSEAEAFGLMAIEAMSCSLPVIVFEGTALPDITFASKSGIALKKGDNDSFVRTVQRLMSSPEECRTRGERARNLVEKHYTIELYHKKLLDLYLSVYNRRKKGVK